MPFCITQLGAKMKRKLSLHDDTASRVDGGMKRAGATPTNTPSVRPNTVFLEGQHIDIAHRNMLNFQFLGQLGHGASAIVEVVKDETTGQKFAHKFFNKYYGTNFEEFKEAFKNEIDIIKRLQSHTHIVKVVGSYACGRELGMLLAPVANGGDLRAYLQDIKDSGNILTENQCSALNHSFGCLVSGLAFIHKHTIRHKDIKPANILIHNDRVIFTDFGIAFNASQQNTTTTGRPGAYTPRYCAPEVANYEPRNRLSDVFSLGCVFLEIMAVLEPNINLGVSNIDPYWKTVDQIHGALSDLITCNHERSQLFRTFCSMLEPDIVHRIDAQALHGRLLNIEDSHPHLAYRLFCDDCAPGTEDDNATVVNGQRNLVYLEKHAMEEPALKASSFNDSAPRENDPFRIRSSFSPLFQEHSNSISMQDSMRKIVERRITWREKSEMYILVSRYQSNPGFIMIGITGSVPRQLIRLGKRCRRQPDEYIQHAQGGRSIVKCANRVVALVFAELQNVRYQESYCEGCRGDHTYWFHTTPEHATKVVKKFSDWIARDPYVLYPTGNYWILSEHAREHDMEMLCQPVPFEE